MKLKEIKRTAIQSWSPAQHHPIFLATGMQDETALAAAAKLCGVLVFFKRRNNHLLHTIA